MNTNNKDTEAKKNGIVRITVVIVLISLLIIGGLVAASNFDFVNFVIKLHGG